MLKRFLVCVLSTVLISACVTTETSNAPVTEENPVVIKQAIAPPKDHRLNAWWSFYNDTTLDYVISSALSLNPQQNNDKTLALISDLIYSYLEYRYTQNQSIWLDDYLNATSPSAKEKVALLEQQKKYTEKLNRLKKKITIQTKLLPEFVDEILRSVQPLPTADISPLLASSTALIDPTPGVFIHTEMNRLFGLDNTVFTNSEGLWKIKPGTAAHNTNTANIQTLDKVKTLERNLIAYTHLREQTRILKKAIKNQNKFDGEGFYKARLGVLRAHYERVKAMSRIYLSLGVY